jgi:membrane-associated phospholipid phosphatase
VFSRLGYEWGVVPLDVLVVLVLAAMRKLREGLFAGVAIIGSALLNLGAKQLFARQRPALWDSIAPESTFSFPSGHAMGSITIAMVLVLLAWHTRWRWWVTLPMAAFTLMVGLSRVYLGVHYPSDILAGWAVAIAWTVGAYLLVFPHGQRPWQER